MGHGAVEAMSKKRVLDSVERRRATAEAGTNAWIDNEVVGCEFEDVRNGKRLRQLLEQLSSKVGAATQWACQDWANTKSELLRGVFCQHLLVVAVDRSFHLDGRQSLSNELGAEDKRPVFAVDSVLVPLGDGVSIFYIHETAQESRCPRCCLTGSVEAYQVALHGEVFCLRCLFQLQFT